MTSTWRDQAVHLVSPLLKMSPIVMIGTSTDRSELWMSACNAGDNLMFYIIVVNF